VFHNLKGNVECVQEIFFILEDKNVYFILKERSGLRVSKFQRFDVTFRLDET
jgi:hypothetical protein